MRKLYITGLLFMSAVVSFAQVSFEQLPPSSPQIIPVFEAVDESAIAFADVDGNGTQDVFITGLNSANEPIAKLYINNGGGNYLESTTSTFEGVHNGSAAFADVDGNGSQDLVVTGANSTPARTAKLYINDGSGTFTLSSEVLDGVIESSIAFADVDGNGSQDLFITGRNTSNIQIGRLYLNNGNGDFTEDAIVLGRVNKGAVAFADVDSNGTQDLMITGLATILGTPIEIADLYLNDGEGDFTKAAATPFVGVSNSAIAFADVDGNGAQDLFITGITAGGLTTSKLYTNGGAGDFTDTGISFEGVRDGAIAFSDVNGNSREDIMLTGLNSSNTRVNRLYINDGSLSFTLDAATPFAAVSESSVAFLDVNGNGIEDLLLTGQVSPTETLTKLYTNDGTGDFKEATGSPFEAVRNSAAAFADVNGDGHMDAIITGRNLSNTAIAKLYTGDVDGNFTEVSGTPFTGVENGAVAFADVDGVNGPDVFITGYNNNTFAYVAELYLNDGSGGFSLSTATTFTGLQNGSISFADVVGDTKPDLLLTGFDVGFAFYATLYQNDGGGNFSEVTGTPFSGVRDGAAAFVDINGAGGLDVLITGRSGGSSTVIAELFRNDGGGVFTEIAAGTFEGVKNSSIAFADVDGVNGQDVLITGLNSSSARVTNLYTNNGDETFTEASTSFPAVDLGEVAFADVDGSGSQDVMISGAISSGVSITKLYTNNGSGTFTEVANMPFEGVSSGAVVFSDAVGNTLEDVLITGRNNAGLPTSKLYRNTTGEVYPTITSGSTAEVAENITATVYTAMADETVTYSLGNYKDEESFTLTADAISFTVAPDFENPLDANEDNVYFIDVIATNSSGNSSTLEVAITVTDVDEVAPTITSAATETVEENTTGVIYTATADESVTFTLGTAKDEALFTLSTDAISFTNAPDFENPLDGNADNVYLVDVIATDAAGNLTTKEVAISVTDVAEPGPTFTSANAITVDENITGTVYTAEVDVTATFSLGTSKDEALFTLNTDEISFTIAPDFENPLDANTDNTYLIDVIATDGDGNATSQQVAITVSDVDEAGPTFTSPASATFEENATGTVYIATTDVSATFSLGNTKDEALFSLTNNVISFNSAPDFENPLDGNADNVYLLDIIATDGDGNTTLLQVAISVTDVDEIAPTITSPAAVAVQENVTSSVYTAAANEAVTFSLGDSKDEALFTLSTDAISFNNAPDFETPADANADNEYLIDVIATDDAGNVTTQEVSITVTDVVEPGPVFTSSGAVTVEENVTVAVYTAAVETTATFTLGNSKDEALFALTTNAVSFIAAPDFETPLDANGDNVYLIDVIATDGDGLTTTKAVSITVTDIDEEAPTITSATSITVAESITGTVYTAEADEAVTFSLGIEKDEALFTLSADALSFNTSPDFEEPLDADANNEYLLDLIATDGAGNTTTLTLAINVTDVDEAPLAVKEDMLFSIYPNPFKNIIVIEAKSGIVKDATISITDLSGKQYKSVSYSGSYLELDLSSLKAGVYIIAIPAAEGTAHYKLVKE